MSAKILITTMGLDIGGAETHIVELSLSLQRRGYTVVIASNGGVFVPTLEQAGIRHYNVPLARRSVKDMLRSLVLLRRIIKSEKPDVVHAHARIPGFLCGILRKTMHFPFVTTAHAHFDVTGLLKLMSNWGQKVLAVSPDIFEYLIENYKLDRGDVRLTVNGIDTEKFSPATSDANIVSEFSIDRSAPVICHVSRLDREASFSARVLLEAFPQVCSVCPGVTLLIAGGGDVFEEISGLAEAVNTQLGRRAVIMTGARGDINEVLAASDLFVGVSRAALEAMSAGLPVILSGAEGYIGLFTPENAEHSRSTNFCGRGDALPEKDTLAGAIIAALTGLSQEQREELSQFGRNYVQRGYSITRMTDDAVEIYDMVRRHDKNVTMSGYYGFGNCGDEAILQSIHGKIDGLDIDVGVTVLSSDPEDTTRRYGYTAVKRFNIFSVLRTLRRCDVLVSGGGSLLQDYTSTRSLLYYLYVIKLAEMMKKKVMIYANGIGPVNKKRNRRLVRSIVSRASVITLRDAASADELRAMGITRDDIHVTADPVFTLTPSDADTARAILAECGIDSSRPFAVVSIRRWREADGFKENLAVLCDRIYSELGLGIVFVAMQFPGDADFSREVQALMSAPSGLVRSGCSAQELMGVISLADFTIAMRLHTLIFSARAGTPLCGIIYDPKITANLNTLGMPAAGTVSAFDADKAFETVTTLRADSDAHRETLRRKSAELEKLANSDTERLLELLRG